MCGPRGLRGSKNILYENRGDGTFRDVTTKAHIDRTQRAFSHSVFLRWTLNDAMVWPDIYVAL